MFPLFVFLCLWVPVLGYFGGDLVAFFVTGWLSCFPWGVVWVWVSFQKILFSAFSLGPSMAIKSILSVPYGVAPAPFNFPAFSFSGLSIVFLVWVSPLGAGVFAGGLECNIGVAILVFSL